MCVKTGLMSELEYENYINEWNNLSNAYVYDSGNYIDIFKTSDILITDCSSFLAEYFPSGNPIIFLNRKDRAPFDSFGEKLKKSFYEINEFNEIPLVLENLIENKNDCLKNARKDLINKFFSHKTASSELIVNHLKKL
jgi:CDP-glycerol glycerophosphotransferase (TagB/SpsB family)